MKHFLYHLDDENNLHRVRLHGIVSSFAIVVNKHGEDKQVTLDSLYMDVGCDLKFKDRPDLVLKDVAELGQECINNQE